MMPKELHCQLKHLFSSLEYVKAAWENPISRREGNSRGYGAGFEAVGNSIAGKVACRNCSIECLVSPTYAPGQACTTTPSSESTAVVGVPAILFPNDDLVRFTTYVVNGRGETRLSDCLLPSSTNDTPTNLHRFPACACKARIAGSFTRHQPQVGLVTYRTVGWPWRLIVAEFGGPPVSSDDSLSPFRNWLAMRGSIGV